MADRKAARRYALAFISLAAELDKIELLAEDLDEAVETLNSGEGLLFRVLCNPVFSVDERRSVLNAVIPGMQMHDMTANLLRLMVDKGRFAALPEVVELYQEEADKRANRLRVEVVTADPLNTELEARIAVSLERATGKKVVLSTKLDDSLIGGMIAHVGGKVYDASVRSRLDDLKHRLIHGAVTAEAS